MNRNRAIILLSLLVALAVCLAILASGILDTKNPDIITTQPAMFKQTRTSVVFEPIVVTPKVTVEILSTAAAPMPINPIEIVATGIVEATVTMETVDYTKSIWRDDLETYDPEAFKSMEAEGRHCLLLEDIKVRFEDGEEDPSVLHRVDFFEKTQIAILSIQRRIEGELHPTSFTFFKRDSGCLEPR